MPLGFWVGIPTTTAGAAFVERVVFPEGNKSLSPGLPRPFRPREIYYPEQLLKARRRFSVRMAGLPWGHERRSSLYPEGVKSRLPTGLHTKHTVRHTELAKTVIIFRIFPDTAP